VHPEFLTQPTDEILETFWGRREAGDESLSGLTAAAGDGNVAALLRQMSDDGMVRLDGDRVELLAPGEERARTIVRCHRLAERLLFDVLSLSAEESEQTACLMEHVLSPAVADAVCAFLGHPPTNPQGLPIPNGTCCTSRGKELRPVVVPLNDLDLGIPARIVFMTPSFHKRVDKLGSYGVIPGSVIRLRQKRPSFVIELEGTSLALDGDVAREIFVRRES
jgi:DtxR family Mn-dependent transcriptional regulator